mgnify:CR=1 FL=1|jgi:hypothetical protein
MKANTKSLLCLIVTFSIFNSVCYAGIFGPDNFEDCVLEKLKGQEVTRYTINLARTVCEEKFPSEKLLLQGTHYQDGDIKINWVESNGDNISIKLEKSTSEYKITKVKLKFSKIPCKMSPKLHEYNHGVMFIFSKWSKKVSEYVVDGNKMKCMLQEEIWGKKK